MAIPFLNNIDLNQNQALNLRLHQLAVAPSGVSGQLFYDTAANRPEWYNGTVWYEIYPFASTNTATTGVLRDASGNFSAGTITAALSGNATTATTLQTGRDFSLTGKATATAVNFNGSAAVALNVTALSVAPGDIGLTNGSLIVGNASNVGVATAKSSIPLSGFGAATADVAMGGFKITNLADPTNPQDAATKAYVDATALGLDVKQSVRLATAAALPTCTYLAPVLTASTFGLLSVDGISVVAGDRILVKNQATAAHNGIYTVTAVGDAYGPWVLTRATDFNTSAEASPGSFTFVEEGSTLSDSGWVMSSNAPITLDTSAINWTQFSGAGSYLAGNGLVLSGSTFHFAQSAAYTANTIPLATGTASIGFIAAGTANQVLRVPGGGGAPAFGAIDLTQTAAVTGALPAANGGTGFSSYTVGDMLYASGSTTLFRLAAVATGNALISGGVGANPAWGKIGLTTHVSGTLPIANGGTNGTATPTANAIAYGTGSAFAFTAAMTAGQILLGNATGVPTPTTVTGDVTISNTGVTAIGTNAVVLSDLAQLAALSVLGNGTNATANVAAISAGTDGNILRRSGTTLGFGSIDLASAGAVGSTILGAANGGTGLAVYAIGDLVYASGTTSLAKLTIAAQYNVLKSSGTAPVWGKVDLNNEVTNTLPAGSGGTGNQFFAVSGPATTVKTFTFRNANSTIPAFFASTLTGNSATTSFTVNHNLNTRDVVVMVLQSASPYAQVMTDVEATDANNVTVRFATAPATGTNYRAVVIGY